MRWGRVRCQVVEVPQFAPYSRLDESCCRDLLPWADPYIAALVAQLDGQKEEADISASRTFSDGSPPYSMAEDGWLNDDASAISDDGLDEHGSHLDFPPVIGGWPLLSDDVSEEEPC